MPNKKKQASKNKKLKSLVPKNLGLHPDESFEDMLQRLGIVDWDWIIVGDGSGHSRNAQCGWGCVTIEKASMHRRLPWYGAMNRGTVNFAEMMAYLQPLSWIAAEEDERQARTGHRRFRNIHIITDSDYCRQQGESDNLMPKKNGALWRLFEDYQRHGLILHWHWRPRTDVALNVYADAISKAARLVIAKGRPQRLAEVDDNGAVPRTVYGYNPST